MHLHRQPFAYTHSLTQINVKNVVRSAFANGGMINTPLMDSGQYLAHAAADRHKCIILENKPDNSAFHEWNRSDLAGSANGSGKISEMGATQQVAKNFSQIQKVTDLY